MAGINEAREMLAGMGKIEVGNRNDIKESTVQVLFNALTTEKSRKLVPYFRAKVTVLVPIVDGKGRKAGEDGYAGHYKGDKISFCFFPGDRFTRDFGPFLCAALNMAPSDAKLLTAEEAQELAIALITCDGQVGCLNGGTAIEMRGVRSAPVKDENDETKITTYINERYDKHVTFESLAAKLDDQDKERYFGSVEAFDALLIEEAEEAAAE